MHTNTFQPQKTTLRHANARLLNRYAPWLEWMLTMTMGDDDLRYTPNEEQVHQQVRHFGQALNGGVWKNWTKRNAKCNILFLPVIEGATTDKRVHAHILLGNVKSREQVDEIVRRYIPRSSWFAPKYDLRAIYDADGLAWYVSKELNTVNAEAMAWPLAIIPRPLMPR